MLFELRGGVAEVRLGRQGVLRLRAAAMQGRRAVSRVSCTDCVQRKDRPGGLWPGRVVDGCWGGLRTTHLVYDRLTVEGVLAVTSLKVKPRRRHCPTPASQVPSDSSGARLLLVSLVHLAGCYYIEASAYPCL